MEIVDVKAQNAAEMPGGYEFSFPSQKRKTYQSNEGYPVYVEGFYVEKLPVGVGIGGKRMRGSRRCEAVVYICMSSLIPCSPWLRLLKDI